MEYTIGELARHSGVSTRALRHYEQLGLVHPSGRTAAGYRVYTERDVIALHRVLAYQQMGLPLKEIEPLLGPEAPSLEAVLERQIATVEVQVVRQQRLLAMLRRVQRRVLEHGPDLVDHLLKLVSFMRTYQRYFTDAELQKIIDFQISLGDDEVRRLKADFEDILRGLRIAMEHGEAPDSDAARPFARRLLAMKMLFPDHDDEQLREHGRSMLASEPALQQQTGITPALIDYMDQAIEAAKEETA
jgi:DNA-binding transcriptional MerR regulator